MQDLNKNGVPDWIETVLSWCLAALPWLFAAMAGLFAVWLNTYGADESVPRWLKVAAGSTAVFSTLFKVGVFNLPGAKHQQPGNAEPE